MSDQLRAGRVKKLLSNLSPSPAADTEPQGPEPDEDGAEVTDGGVATVKKKAKKKKPDDEGSDEPADVNATY